jgi:hypothetical protein
MPPMKGPVRRLALALLGLLLAAGPASAQQFLGGALVPEVDAKGMLLVHATVFWVPGSELPLSGPQVQVNGNIVSMRPVGVPQVDAGDPRFTRVDQDFGLPLDGSGFFPIIAAGCCWARGIPNVESGPEVPFELSARILWNGETRSAPIQFDLGALDPSVQAGMDYLQNLKAQPGPGITLSYEARLPLIGMTSQAPGLAIDQKSGDLFVPAAETAKYPENPLHAGDVAFSGIIFANDDVEVPSYLDFQWAFDVAVAPPTDDHTPPVCAPLEPADGPEFLSGFASDETGIAEVALAEDAVGLSLFTDEGFQKGDPDVTYFVGPGEGGTPASGTIVVTDTSGNSCSVFLDLPDLLPPVFRGGWGEDAELVLSPFESLWTVIAFGDAGLEIWDLGPPGFPSAQPFLVDSFRKQSCRSGGKRRRFYADDVEVVSGSEAGPLAFVAAGRCGVFVLDLGDAGGEEGIRRLGRLKTAGHVEDVAVLGQVAYVADHDGGLVTADVSDPTRPRELSRLGFANPEFGAAIDLVAVARGERVLVFVGTTEGLFVVDATDPANPTLLGSKRYRAGKAAVEDVEVAGDFAFLALWQKGVRVLDVSDPGDPREVGRIDVDAPVYEVHVVNQTLMVAAGPLGLLSYDLARPGLPPLQRTPIPIGSGEEQTFAWDVDTLPSLPEDAVVSFGVRGNPRTGGFQVLDFTSARRGCGLGSEIALLLPAIFGLRRRRRRTA